MAIIDPGLLEIMVCPADRGELELLESEAKLRCRVCRRRYRIEEGIPVMLIDEAELEGEEKQND